MGKPLRVLMVEDSEGDVLLVIRTLKKGGYEPVHRRVETAETMCAALRETAWDVILCDYQMPKFNGLTAIALLKETALDIPLIIVSGAIGEEIAVDCMRFGAKDYVMKGNLSRLVPAVERELRDAESRTQRKRAEEMLVQKNKRLDLAQSVAKAGIWDWDIATGRIEWSSHMFDLFGLNSQGTKASFEAWRSVLHPEDVEIAGQRIDRALKEKTHLNSDYRVILPDGRIRWINAVGEGEYDSHGHPIRMIGICIDISERKRTEEELKESERVKSDLLEKMNEAQHIAMIGSWEWDLKTNCVWWSDETYRIFGVTPEDFVPGFEANGKFIHPDDFECYGRLFDHSLKTGEPLDFYFRLIANNGLLKHCHARGITIRDDSGQPMRFIGTIMDITELKTAEEALKKSDEMLRLISENMSDMIRVTDLQGNNIYASPSHFKCLGYKPEERVGKSGFDIVHPEDVERLIKKFAEGLAGKQKHITAEYRARHVDGHYIWLETIGDLLWDAQGNPTSIIMSSRDISERKQAEDALKISEKKYRLLHESMMDGFVSVGMDGKFLECNEIYRNMLGYSETELASLSYIELTPEKWHAYETDIVQNQILKRGYSDVYEKEYLRKDGTIFPVELHTVLIRDEQGNPVNMWAIARDITERKRAEKELKKKESYNYALFEYNPEQAIAVDLEGKVIAVNRAKRMSGDRLPDIGDVMYRDYANSHEIDMHSELMECLRSGKLKVFPEQKYREKILSISIAPFSSGAVIISNDITERKKAETAIRESEANYKQLFDSSPSAIYQIDFKTGKFLKANDIVCEYYGCNPVEITSRSPYDILTDESKRLLSERLRKMGLGEVVANDPEYEVVDKNGQCRWLQLTSKNIYDTEGLVVGADVVAHEVTDRKCAEKQLQETLESLRKAVGTTIQVMVSAVETRDPYTSGHQVRSADLARAIATEMELPQDKIDGIRMAASVHDIGKLSIPAEILSKPTKLSDIEFGLIKEHARRGYEILKDVVSPWPLAEIVYQHHERMDGSGYPRQLKGDDILIEARILTVSDVVEAMASHRPYRPGLGISAALDEIEKSKGVFYDETVVDACLRLCREKGFKFV